MSLSLTLNAATTQPGITYLESASAGWPAIGQYGKRQQKRNSVWSGVEATATTNPTANIQIGRILYGPSQAGYNASNGDGMGGAYRITFVVDNTGANALTNGGIQVKNGSGGGVTTVSAVASTAAGVCNTFTANIYITPAGSVRSGLDLATSLYTMSDDTYIQFVWSAGTDEAFTWTCCIETIGNAFGGQAIAHMPSQ